MLEDDDGETFFGSLDPGSTAGEFDVRDYLSRPLVDELGKRQDWLGQHLARLYALDLFLNNPDRSLRNFLLEHDTNRLCAFDFAAVRLTDLSGVQFPVEKSPTVSVGRFLRDQHGFDPAFALEMVDRIAAVPVEAIRTLMGEMPAEWLTSDQKEELCEVWSNQRLQRLSALRAGLSDGSLL